MGNSTSSAHQFDNNIVTERMIPRRKGTAPARAEAVVRLLPKHGGRAMLEHTRPENVPHRPPWRAEKS
jgi:hypothetical protein